MSWPRPAVAPNSSPTTAPTMARPKLMWRLARIQESADGMMISVVNRRLFAPRMRALATRLRSTSRTPWKALKKTTKNTRTTAVAALPESDRPNMMAKREPSTTRGMALAALMKGERTSASRSMRPNRMPKTTPRSEPTRKPSGASTGFPSPACGGGSGWGFCEPTSDRGSVLLTLIAHQHLIAQLTPNRLIDLGEPRLEPDLRDVAGARQIDRVSALDRSGTSGQKDHPVGEGDRLFQVVGDEHHRC